MHVNIKAVDALWLPYDSWIWRIENTEGEATLAKSWTDMDLVVWTFSFFWRKSFLSSYWSWSLKCCAQRPHKDRKWSGPVWINLVYKNCHRSSYICRHIHSTIAEFDLFIEPNFFLGFAQHTQATVGLKWGSEVWILLTVRLS